MLFRRASLIAEAIALVPVSFFESSLDQDMNVSSSRLKFLLIPARNLSLVI